jgi:hypothetical protein
MQVTELPVVQIDGFFNFQPILDGDGSVDQLSGAIPAKGWKPTAKFSDSCNPNPLVSRVNL